MITSMMLHTKSLENLQYLDSYLADILSEIPTESGDDSSSYIKEPTGTKSVQQTTEVVTVETEEGPVEYRKSWGTTETQEGEKTSWYRSDENDPTENLEVLPLEVLHHE